MRGRRGRQPAASRAPDGGRCGPGHRDRQLYPPPAVAARASLGKHGERPLHVAERKLSELAHTPLRPSVPMVPGVPAVPAAPAPHR